MLQLTIGSEHVIVQSGLGAGVQHARRGSWVKAPYRLVFVVPPEVSDKYKSHRQGAPGIGADPYVDPWTGQSTKLRPTVGSGQADHIEPLLDENRFTAGRVRSAANRVNEVDGRLPCVVWELVMNMGVPSAQLAQLGDTSAEGDVDSDGAIAAEPREADTAGTAATTDEGSEAGGGR